MTDSDYDYDPFADDDELEAKPKPRQIPLPHCVHCPDREVTSDGKSGWVHNDDYMYACDYGNPQTTWAQAALATGEIINAH